MSEWKKYRITHEFKAPEGLAEKIKDLQHDVIRGTKREGRIIFGVTSKVEIISEFKENDPSCSEEAKEK